MQKQLEHEEMLSAELEEKEQQQTEENCNETADGKITVPEKETTAEDTAKTGWREKRRQRKEEKQHRRKAAAYAESQLPDLGGPVLRRSLWREWRTSTLVFCFVSVYLELCLHICVFGEVGERALYLVLFGVMFGVAASFLCTMLPKLPGRILTVFLVAIQVLYAEVQLVYHAIFGNFMPLSLARMGEGVVTNFGNQILYGIGQKIFQILLLLVPLILISVLLIRRKAPRRRVSWKQSLCSLLVLTLVGLYTYGMMLSSREETFSVYEILTNVNTSTDTSYKNVGMLATTEQELRYMLTGASTEDVELNETSLGCTVSPHKYSSREYNVLESIDFEALAQSTDDESLKKLDEYMATVVPTRKNDYTGMLKGYNLITICAESFCPWFISEELTPTLYQLSHNGILFDNYYGTFQSVTTNGEYTMNMGLYPDMSRTKTQSSFDVSAGNYLPMCLGNAMKSIGYQTWAYHNYIGDFYNRNITHANMGYTFQAADSGLDIQVDWPSSDLEMMEASVSDYLESGQPFHAYYMTFSGHYQYNWENAMSAKNQKAVEGLNYSETVKAYIACNLELEYALRYLMEQLEEAGVADKTCIVLTNDHYPYGLTEEEYDELCGKHMDVIFEKYRNSFICYVPGLKENIHVKDYCSTADILPTMLNLFGIDFDSRLLMGTDVLSSGVHVAVLSDYSFLTSDFRFDAGTERVYPHGKDKDRVIPEDTLNNYRSYVINKFALSTDILNTNYYAHVFGQESSDSDLEDTVVFTDINGIFNQASVLYMYRNGYVDPETPDTFGGRYVSELGEFVDVLYRIAECPESSPDYLPEGYAKRDFTESYPYYDAVCWAFETGIVREDDADEKWDDDMDYRSAALLIYRFAQHMGVDTSLDERSVNNYIEEHPRLSPEVIRAFLWVDKENITTKDSELQELFDNYSARISRYQMTSFLFYLCTYELHIDE
ncbi:MAG: LTA synthase family protein [Oscillospiraceae bacterium]|nr:LTA synthase family protein [Oscillospiraceae bacterium]